MVNGPNSSTYPKHKPIFQRHGVWCGFQNKHTLINTLMKHPHAIVYTLHD